jgi:hypothetical protein
MKVINYRNISVLLLAAFTLFLTDGCKSKKNIIAGGGVLKEKPHPEVFQDVLKAEIDYKTISAKGNIGYEINGSGRKASAVFKIEKDRMMQVSVRFLGTEVARVTITPDSIYAVNRLRKQYVAENISSLRKVIDFDYYNLQALMTNQIFYAGKKEVSQSDYNNFDMTTTGNHYILQAKAGKSLMYNFSVDASDRIVSTIISNSDKEAEKNVTVRWSYDDFIKDPDNKLIYPTVMNAKIEAMKKRGNIEISYSKLNINDKEFEVNNIISSSYSKKTLKEFISSLP